MLKTALIILAEGFEESEAIITIDILRRAQVAVTIAGLTTKTVVSSRKISINADTVLDDAGTTFDALILPGGMPGTSNLLSDDRVLSLVKMVYTSGRICAAVCAAPKVFGKAGILKGHRYCCFPGAEKDITDGTLVTSSVCVDTNIITSRSFGTSIEFGLAIVEVLMGSDEADKVRKAIVFEG